MSSSLHLITAPTADVVSLEEARAMVPPLASAADAAVELLLAAAVQMLDPAGGGWLGRALRPQTWELRADAFPAGAIDSFVYDDGDGVEQTLAEDTGYRLFGLATKSKARLLPPLNGSWPAARAEPESLRIRFTCGHAVAESAAGDMLPAPIKQAVALLAKVGWSDMERNLYISQDVVEGVGSRSYVVTENAARVMNLAAQNLLSTYRVWS